MITVALPMLRAKWIGWLAFESLCRQKKVDFLWELIVCEETAEHYQPMGEDIIKEKYVDRLKKINCKRVKYIGLDNSKRISLSMKLKMIAKSSYSKSKWFLLQDADCYSQPYRLFETKKIAKSVMRPDWIHSPKGLFYDIKTETVVSFKQIGITALNMAVKMNLMRNILPAKKFRSVNAWMYNGCTKVKGKNLIVGLNNSNNWLYGIDTHGLNTISHSRVHLITDCVRPFYEWIGNINDYIPPDIINKLKQLKEKCYVEK